MDNIQKQRFTEIFNKNLFVGKSSRSGEGSSLEQTKILRKELLKLFKELNIKKILDAPCGDWNWMKEMDLAGIEYIGIDIVDQIIEENKKKYSASNIKFLSANIIEDQLPKADLIFCRDCLVHLTYKDIFKTLNNFKKSGSTYLLTTTFPAYGQENRDLITGGIWRALNLENTPFYFTKPIKYIIEQNSNTLFHEKTLGLWDLNALKTV